MSDDFGYLNARIRARRALLLHEGFFREALNMSFPELVKVLGETVYGPDLSGDDLGAVDRAVEVHLDRTVSDLPRLASGEAREAVNLLLVRADLVNVKVILRGKGAGRSAEEIRGVLAGGTLPRVLYGAMVEAPDAPALAQLLSLPRHPIARALRAAVQAARDPLETEFLLDKTFYESVLRFAQGLDQPYLAGFIAFEIDALNLASGLKLAETGFEGQAGRFFLVGGRRVDQGLFERLANGEVAALEELADTDFAGVSEVKSLSALERELHCILLRKARACGKDVLGPGLAIDYIERKGWEAGRIRLLSRRAFYRVSPALIEEEVFCS